MFFSQKCAQEVFDVPVLLPGPADPVPAALVFSVAVHEVVKAFFQADQIVVADALVGVNDGQR